MMSCECRKPGMTNQLFRNGSLTEVEIVVDDLLNGRDRTVVRKDNCSIKEFRTAIVQENKVTN
jgi:hypothetical protein